jgi:hypothetical protein
MRVRNTLMILPVVILILPFSNALSLQNALAQESEFNATDGGEVPFVYPDDPFSSFLVQGNYSDAEAGIEIQLPDDWTGIRLGSLGAMITPSGSAPFPDIRNSSTIMMINVLNMTMLTEGAKYSMQDLARYQNLTTRNISNSTIQCTESKSYIMLNDMVVMHAVSGCQDPNDESKYTKLNIYNVATKENLVSVALVRSSPQSYEQFIDEFEQSIKTLKVKNSIDHRTIWTEPLGLKSETYNIEAEGTKVDVALESNSEISNFAFDEQGKKLSFTVQGENGTSGLAIIPISKFLEGPYSITMDGQVAKGFVVTDDQIAGQSLLEISYHHSSHDIVVTGTNVVPEFPVPLIGVVAAILVGVMAVIGRSRLLGCHIQDLQ